MSNGLDENTLIQVRLYLEQHFQNFDIWPKNIFKLECEKYGIYQNQTGMALDHLINHQDLREHSIETDSKTIKFISEHETGTITQDSTVVENTKAFYENITDTGHFASLVGYIAVCKVYDELENASDITDVLPEGNQGDTLFHTNRVPDGLMIYPNEYVPIEVYNGTDYLSRRTDKYRQLEGLSCFEYDVDESEFVRTNNINSHPLLINRRAADDVRSALWHMNGLAINTDCMFACEPNHGDLKSLIEFFRLDEFFHFLPKFDTTLDDTLDGITYENRRSGSDPIRVRPPEIMIEDANQIPDQYLKRVRGGVQLHYVNYFYRRFSDSTRKDACFVLQELYNQLLRQGGKERSTALDDAWLKASQKYRRLRGIDHRQQEMILDQAIDLIDRLIDENIIFPRDGKLYARKSSHPQPSLADTWG